MKHTSKFTSLMYHLIIAGIFAYSISIMLIIDLPYAWIAALNLLLFASFGWDKFSAIRNWKRTPETTFLIMALLGAFPSLFLGRKIFNHKTSKTSFIIPMWILFIGQILASAFLLGDTDKFLSKPTKKAKIECEEQSNCQ